MKAKVSKAQKEVWEWKEKVSKKLLELPQEERSKYILQMTKRTMEELKKHKKNVA